MYLNLRWYSFRAVDFLGFKTLWTGKPSSCATFSYKPLQDTKTGGQHTLAPLELKWYSTMLFTPFESTADSWRGGK